MLKLIKRINKNGTTIIITSHLLWEVELLCDEVAIINQGTIVKKGTPDELKKTYSKDKEIRLESIPGKYKKIASKLKKDIRKIKYTKTKMIIYTPKPENILPQLLKTLHQEKETIIELKVKKPSLSEVFEMITKHE